MPLSARNHLQGEITDVLLGTVARAPLSSVTVRRLRGSAWRSASLMTNGRSTFPVTPSEAPGSGVCALAEQPRATQISASDARRGNRV